MSRPRHKPPKPYRPVRRPREGHPGNGPSERLLLYGLHAVRAALANPRRDIGRVLATENAAHRLDPQLKARRVTPILSNPKELDRLLGPDAVHQGVVLETRPLPPCHIDDIASDGVMVVLDQVTDPHNVGAVLRSAAAFGATALLMPERHSPPLGGVLAKAASGALDVVPLVLVGNLARALHELGERGVLRVGLGEEASEPLEAAHLTQPLALVLGAEGKGLRQLTREHCDLVCSISTEPGFASLNVSNAAAIALHWAKLKTHMV